MILSTHGFLASSGGVAIDADAQAFFDRVTTAGGTLSTTEKTAVNTLVIQMKNDGIWTKMKAIYPMVGASAAACAQNLKSSSFTGSFTAGWIFASTGAKPNGAGAFMNTNLALTGNVAVNNYHLSYYSRTQNNTTGANDMGVGVVGGNIGLTFYYAIISVKFFATGRYTPYYVTSPNNDTTGFLIGNRQSATSAKLIQDNVTLNSIAISDNQLSTNNMTLGGSNSTNEYSNRECAFSSIGDGLTDTEASNFYTAVQAFQTTLSRNV
jgi:hypothetical protein